MGSALLLRCCLHMGCTDTAKVLFTYIVMQQAAAHSNAHSCCHYLQLLGCRQAIISERLLFVLPTLHVQPVLGFSLPLLVSHCQSWLVIASPGFKLPVLVSHCHSRFPIASLGSSLPVLVSHCQSWFPIATLGFPLPVLARHCQSWLPIASLGFPLPLLVSHCQSWLVIASLGFPLPALGVPLFDRYQNVTFVQWWVGALTL